MNLFSFSRLFHFLTPWVHWFTIDVYVSLLKLQLYTWMQTNNWVSVLKFKPVILCCSALKLCENNYSQKAKWKLSNNPLDFVCGIIRQYSVHLRQIIAKIHLGWSPGTITLFFFLFQESGSIPPEAFVKQV